MALIWVKSQEILACQWLPLLPRAIRGRWGKDYPELLGFSLLNETIIYDLCPLLCALDPFMLAYLTEHVCPFLLLHYVILFVVGSGKITVLPPPFFAFVT